MHGGVDALWANKRLLIGAFRIGGLQNGVRSKANVETICVITSITVAAEWRRNRSTQPASIIGK